LRPRSFFIGGDGRLHAPWRLVVFLLLSALCTGLVALVALPLLRGADQVLAMQGAAESLVFTVGLITAHAIMLYGIDRRGWDTVGLGEAAAQPRVLVRGWLLGALPILVPSVLLLLVHALSLRPSTQGSWWLAAARLSVFLLPAALFEELLSRGYLFATIREWLGWPVALGVTSLGFGLLHLGNPGANAQSVIMVTLAGVFLGAVLIATGSLYAAWMAHWAWNWVMAVLLHAAVSGVPMPRPDYQTVDSGPDWITGGLWGPEGGAGAAAGMLLTLAYLYRKRLQTRHEPG
jgi:membrane protease YdiL (CAAX protease family)